MLKWSQLYKNWELKFSCTRFELSETLFKYEGIQLATDREKLDAGYRSIALNQCVRV